MYNKITYTLMAVLVMVIAAVSFLIFSNEAAKNDVYKVYTEDGYKITNQEMVEAKIDIDVEDLSEDLDLWKIIDILSETQKDHVVAEPVFENETTKIYLESVSMETEESEIITLAFDVVYEIPAKGDILTILTVDGSKQTSCVELADGNVKDGSEIFEGVLNMQGQGTKLLDNGKTKMFFMVEMPTDVYYSCENEINFGVMLNQISYEEN